MKRWRPGSVSVLAVSVLVLLSVLLVGCGGGGRSKPEGAANQGAAEEKPDRNNTFVLVTRVRDKINPLLDMDLDRAPLWLFNGLVTYTSDLQVKGDLAESWDISPDGKSYTFHLRRNVKWHDGQPFTADDVVFTVNTALDEKNKSYMRTYFLVNGKPVQVKKVDDYTVEFTLPEPSATFLFNVWKQNTVIVPKHLLEGKDLQTADFNQHPIGTGPYMFVSYTPKQQLLMRANPNYHFGKPKIPFWMFKEIGDQNAALAALARDDVTMVGVGTKSVRETAAAMPGVKVYGYDSGWVYGLSMNVKRFPLDDRRVRQAVAYAIDREGMVKSIVGQDTPVAWSLIGPTQSWAYKQDIKKYPQDVEKAKQLLVEAGFKPGKDGILSKDGKQAKFTILIQAGATDADPMSFALAIQQALKNVGIAVEIQQLDRGTLQPRLFNDKDFDAYIWWDGYAFEPDLSAFWTVASCPNGYVTPELEGMVLKANTAVDQKDRKAQLDAIADRIAEDVPFIPLYFYRGYVAIHDYVENLPPPSAADPNNTAILYDVEKLSLRAH